MQPLPENQGQILLDALAAWAGGPWWVRASHRPMMADEVMVLAEGGLIEIGAHTVTHPSLPSLAQAAQLAEIAQSKAQAEALMGRPVTSFSYPHGEYTPDTVALVREAGFTRACCSVAVGALTPHFDALQLPRLPVRNWNGGEFIARIGV